MFWDFSISLFNRYGSKQIEAEHSIPNVLQFLFYKVKFFSGDCSGPFHVVVEHGKKLFVGGLQGIFHACQFFTPM